MTGKANSLSVVPVHLAPPPQIDRQKWCGREISQKDLMDRRALAFLTRVFQDSFDCVKRLIRELVKVAGDDSVCWDKLAIVLIPEPNGPLLPGQTLLQVGLPDVGRIAPLPIACLETR